MSTLARILALSVVLSLGPTPAMPRLDTSSRVGAQEVEGGPAAEASRIGKRIHDRIWAIRKRGGIRQAWRAYEDLPRNERRSFERYVSVTRFRPERMLDSERAAFEAAAKLEMEKAGVSAAAQRTSGCRGDGISAPGLNPAGVVWFTYSQYFYWCGDGQEVTYVTCTASASADGFWSFEGHATDCGAGGVFAGGVGRDRVEEVSQGSFKALCYEGTCLHQSQPYVGHRRYSNGWLYETWGDGRLSPLWAGPVGPNGFTE